MDKLNYVPSKNDSYIKFGYHDALVKIIETKRFYPVFISGLSGNGKTFMVEQVCSELNRECIRVNVSVETDETDLIGGQTLVDGNVQFVDGPVLIAMRRGAILLIDEVDRGSNKLICLQGILEGKSYYNKKTNEVVHAAPGFNVIATANSKGQGSESGKYLSQILDDAFIERFAVTFEQQFPAEAIEMEIVNNIINDDVFSKQLVDWANTTRKTYIDGGIDDCISTRRLVHIGNAYQIFGDKATALTHCIARYDDDVKESFMTLFKKIAIPEDGEEPILDKPKGSFKEVEF